MLIFAWHLFAKRKLSTATHLCIRIINVSRYVEMVKTQILDYNERRRNPQNYRWLNNFWYWIANVVKFTYIGHHRQKILEPNTMRQSVRESAIYSNGTHLVWLNRNKVCTAHILLKKNNDSWFDNGIITQMRYNKEWRSGEISLWNGRFDWLWFTAKSSWTAEWMISIVEYSSKHPSTNSGRTKRYGSSDVMFVG